ncbi:hypothetical protein KAT08_02845 [Candidatus Babeliales bacterium]|nr:hypothetical protein [Candidatus Babeliales bacterium]
MKIFKKVFFPLALVFSLGTCSAKLVEINKFNVSASRGLGDIALYHGDETFYVKHDGILHTVQNCFVDKAISNISTEELQKVLGNVKEIEIDGQKVIMVKVSPEKVEKIIRHVDTKDISKLEKHKSNRILEKLSESAYIKIEQKSNGEYTLCFNVRLSGGGVWGAIGGAWIGKFVSSAVCHGAILAIGGVVSIVATPAAGALVVMSLETTLAAPIEATTTAMALAGGIAGGVATGPI